MTGPAHSILWDSATVLAFLFLMSSVSTPSVADTSLLPNESYTRPLYSDLSQGPLRPAFFAGMAQPGMMADFTWPAG